MATWFIGKGQYTKQIDAGKFQSVTEAYAFDAVSYTDAEARLYDRMADVGADFKVVSISPLKVQEVFEVEGSEIKWFKCKIITSNFDEKTKKEKKVASSFLINAKDIPQAYLRLESELGRMDDYEITDVVLTPILEVHPFDPGKQVATSQ